MSISVEEIFEISAAIIASLGGAALLLGAFSSWLGSVWAKRMLLSERAKNEEMLEGIKTELEVLKQKELTRHFDKLAIYKDVVHLISEILRELEAVSLSKQTSINPDIEHSFSLCRNKAYGYISLVSTQEVMDKYNDMIDFFMPIMYEGKTTTWAELRTKADALLNEMRSDLGIKDGAIVYRGGR